MDLEKKGYITEEEQSKCQKVKEAFAELYEKTDVTVLDAGRFGFIKLEYYREGEGFDTFDTVTDSETLFKKLWDSWNAAFLLDYYRGTPQEELDYEAMCQCLPPEKQAELARKKAEFAQKAGL